jgi:putative copper resistance protein D
LFWLLKDFDLFSVLLRAASLALEALTVGGVAFLLIAAIPSQITSEALRRLRTATSRAGLALAVVQVLGIAVSSAILIGGSGFSFREVTTADFFIWGTLLTVSATAVFLLMRASSRWTMFATAPFVLLIMLSSLGMSHAASRLDNRLILLLLTAFHHLGSAAWIGAMPFLLMALSREEAPATAARYVRRFSTMAIWSVSLLLIGGIGMSFFYVGSLQGVYGTTYGIMLLAKVYMFLVVVGMGAGNFFVVRQIERAPASLLVRLRRFSEAEIGLGFTAILAAASLTSQPPAVDLVHDRLTAHEIVERMHWVKPRLTSPPVQALVPPTGIRQGIRESLFSSGWTNDANDRAWSEYNHHWAGLIVLVAGLLALLARSPRFRWAQYWPLLFIALAVFIVLRADPENWPLGPRSFWASFASPDVLQHRTYALLIVAFALFEWAAETNRIKVRAACYVFPLLCAVGGALMMTHSHPLSNLKDSMLIEMTHTPIALLGATAGWSRWLELRLPQKRNSKIASYIWPVCLMLVGIVLLDYRES